MDYNIPTVDLTDQQLLWRRKRIEDKIMNLERRRSPLSNDLTLEERIEKWQGKLKTCVEEILRRGLDDGGSYPQSLQAN